MATQRLRLKPPSALTAEQKVAFALLVFLGSGGVVFGAQSFGANMMRPIQTQIAEFYAGEALLTSDERADLELEASRTKDTDGDGLVDYDELYVYKTSPYIADSDSDGFDDKQEVFSGNNPNCPMGKVCGFTRGSLEEVGDSESVEDLIEGLGGEALLGVGDVSLESEEDVAAFFQQATMEQIRAALISAGMSKEELDQIDDEMLQAFFSGVLDEAAVEGTLEEFVNTEQ